MYERSPELPRALDREEIARVEVGHTNVSPLVARALVVWFLAVLAALPLVEFAGPSGGGAGATAWTHLEDLPEEIARQVASLKSTGTESPGAWQTILAANRAALGAISAFETALEDESPVGRLLRPPMQYVLTTVGGAGNEQVYVGHDGWLFFRPDVDYVTGRGFLEPRQLERRVAAASEHETAPHPDPRPAILRFGRDLASRGITLIVVPTPVKPSIHPEHLAPRFDPTPGGVVQNPSFDRLVADLQREGVLVFDPAPVIAGPAAGGTPQYLATDTHWRPEAMQSVAEALADFLRRQVALPALPAPGYRAEPREARNIGDTAAMLEMNWGRTSRGRTSQEQISWGRTSWGPSPFAPEGVTLRFVVDASGDPWRASRDADILVLGDSFANIYSLPSMGWGEAAGFVEQVSYALQRPLDRLVQNDDGAYATRALLDRERDAGVDRLAGKRVVIWQFASRELAFGDWRP